MIGGVSITKVEQRGPYAIFQIDGVGYFGLSRIDCQQSGAVALDAQFNPAPPRQVSSGFFQMVRESNVHPGNLPLGDESLSFVIEEL